MQTRDPNWGSPSAEGQSWHATTILTIRKDGRVVIAGDGQVSLGATIIKANARKVRQIGKGDVSGSRPSSSNIRGSS
jgi:ATP-dependent HslUV protease subunit HslV